MPGNCHVPAGPGIKKRVYYSGILASMPKVLTDKKIDYLILISGMEPQRTALEKILLPQVKGTPRAEKWYCWENLLES